MSEIRLVMNSRVLGARLTFFRSSGATPQDKTYISVRYQAPTYSSIDQICDRGRLRGGSCLMADDSSFQRVCRTWYRSYIKNARDIWPEGLV